jgi:hypothetical protein
MAINERAKNHYENAVHFMTAACQSEDYEQTVMFTELVKASLELAHFCVTNHALVSGVDTDAPIQPGQPNLEGTQKMWGGGPMPEWVQRAQAAEG